MRIEPWGAGDKPLLDQLLGDPAMMVHLGGPESAEKLAERQGRYEQPDSGMFSIVDVGLDHLRRLEPRDRRAGVQVVGQAALCLLYTSPSPRDS